MTGCLGWIRMGVILCAAMQVAGCTEVQALQDWISPPTPAQMNARLQEQATQGHPAEALAASEAYLARHPADADELHRSMARMYLAQGNSEAAARHLMRASPNELREAARRERANAPSAPDPAPAPDLDATPRASSAPTVHAARRAASAPAVDAAPPAVFGAAVDGASAQFLPDGSISVRAGDATASTGNFSR